MAETTAVRFAYVLEPMRLDHVAQVVRIERTTFSNPWPPDAFEHEIEKNPYSHPTVARLASRGAPIIAGYYVIWIVFDDMHIQNLAVHPQHQRQGLGRFLLSHALEKGRQAGAMRAALEVRESNTAARRLYASAGFREIGRRRAYYSRPREDAILCEKDPLEAEPES